MIIAQTGTHNRSENGHSAWDAMYDNHCLTVTITSLGQAEQGSGCYFGSFHYVDCRGVVVMG
jgi:hypothetical protein